MFSISEEIPAARRAYQLRGGPVGVLILHGFMGSPGSSRPLAQYLHQCGLTVHCPRLAGHGHLPSNLDGISHKQWLRQAEQAFAELQRDCPTTYVIGHSMGCVLGAHLAVHAKIDGLAMLAPLYTVPHKAIYAMALLRYVVRWLYPLKMGKLIPRHVIEERVLDFDPGIDIQSPEVQAWLLDGTRIPTAAFDEMRKVARYGQRLWPQCKSPALILQGDADEAIDPAYARIIYNSLPAQDKTLHTIAEGTHELMRPFDKTHHETWQRLYQFIIVGAIKKGIGFDAAPVAERL